MRFVGVSNQSYYRPSNGNFRKLRHPSSTNWTQPIFLRHIYDATALLFLFRRWLEECSSINMKKGLQDPILCYYRSKRTNALALSPIERERKLHKNAIMLYSMFATIINNMLIATYGNFRFFLPFNIWHVFGNGSSHPMMTRNYMSHPQTTWRGAAK